MGSDDRRFLAVGLWSTHVELLEDGKAMLDRARELGDAAPAKALCACAALLAAAALEQAIDEALRVELKTRQGLDDSPASAIADALNMPVRWRLVNVPAILSCGSFEVIRASPGLKTLHRLIDLRNRLVHRRDPVYAVQGELLNEGEEDVDATGGEDLETSRLDSSVEPGRRVRISGKLIGEAGDAKMIQLPDGRVFVHFPPPENTWRTVSSEDADKYLSAVGAYIREGFYAGGRDGALAFLRRVAGPADRSDQTIG